MAYVMKSYINLIFNLKITFMQFLLREFSMTLQDYLLVILVVLLI